MTAKPGFELVLWSNVLVAHLTGTDGIDGYYEQQAVEFLCTRDDGRNQRILQHALSAIRNIAIVHS